MTESLPTKKYIITITNGTTKISPAKSGFHQKQLIDLKGNYINYISPNRSEVNLINYKLDTSYLDYFSKDDFLIIFSVDPVYTMFSSENLSICVYGP